MINLDSGKNRIVYNPRSFEKKRFCVQHVPWVYRRSSKPTLILRCLKANMDQSSLKFI